MNRYGFINLDMTQRPSSDDIATTISNLFGGRQTTHSSSVPLQRGITGCLLVGFEGATSMIRLQRRAGLSRRLGERGDFTHGGPFYRYSLRLYR